jgi:exodeoxyribonuclease VII small subunit
MSLRDEREMSKNTSPDSEAVPPKFEAAVAELEGIVQSMETGQLSLEESLEAYRRGALLLKHCQQQLGDAEQRLQILEAESLQPLKLDAIQ